MISKLPGRRRLSSKATGYEAPLRLKDAPRAIVRTLVYIGLIVTSILIWWAVGRLAFGG